MYLYFSFMYNMHTLGLYILRSMTTFHLRGLDVQGHFKLRPQRCP